jgi:hypothetical protein
MNPDASPSGRLEGWATASIEAAALSAQRLQAMECAIQAG